METDRPKEVRAYVENLMKEINSKEGFRQVAYLAGFASGLAHILNLAATRGMTGGFLEAKRAHALVLEHVIDRRKAVEHVAKKGLSTEGDADASAGGMSVIG